MVHPSCPALRFWVCSHLAQSCSKGNLRVPPPIIVVTGYKVSWSPFNSLVFGPSSSSWRDESRRVNHSAQKVRPKWPKQQELIKFEIHPNQFEVLFWLTCPGDQVMPYKSQPFTLELEAEKKPDSSLTWYPKLLVKRCFNSYGTVLKGKSLGVISGCCLYLYQWGHLPNVHVMIFRNRITLHCCMKGDYWTPFHAAHRLSPAAPRSSWVRGAWVRHKRETEPTQSSLDTWLHLSTWSTMAVSSFSIRSSINSIAPHAWWFWGSCGSARALCILCLLSMSPCATTLRWADKGLPTFPGGKLWSTGLLALEQWRHWQGHRVNNLQLWLQVWLQSHFCTLSHTQPTLPQLDSFCISYI